MNPTIHKFGGISAGYTNINEELAQLAILKDRYDDYRRKLKGKSIHVGLFTFTDHEIFDFAKELPKNIQNTSQDDPIYVVNTVNHALDDILKEIPDAFELPHLNGLNCLALADMIKKEALSDTTELDNKNVMKDAKEVYDNADKHFALALERLDASFYEMPGHHAKVRSDQAYAMLSRLKFLEEVPAAFRDGDFDPSIYAKEILAEYNGIFNQEIFMNARDAAFAASQYADAFRMIANDKNRQKAGLAINEAARGLTGEVPEVVAVSQKYEKMLGK